MANLFQNNPFGNPFNFGGGGGFVSPSYSFTGVQPAWNYQGANFMNEFATSNIGLAPMTGFMAQSMQGTGKAPVLGFSELAPTSGPGANMDYATFSEAEAPVAYTSETDNYMSDLGRIDQAAQRRAYRRHFYGLNGMGSLGDDSSAIAKSVQLRIDISTYCTIKNKDKALAALSDLLNTASSIQDPAEHTNAMNRVTSATTEVQNAFPGPGIGDDIQAALPGLAVSGGQLASMFGLFGKKKTAPATTGYISTGSSNTGLYAAVGIGVLALVAAGVFFMKRSAPRAAAPLSPGLP